MDGTNAISQCGIPPGETMNYNFTLEDWVGTTWYQYVPVFNIELGPNKFDFLLSDSAHWSTMYRYVPASFHPSSYPDT